MKHEPFVADKPIAQLNTLAAVGRDTALYKQTLDKLGETEVTITTLSTAIGKAAAEIEMTKEQLQGHRQVGRE